MKVNILGTEYTIEYKADEQIAKEMDTRIGVCGGYCNPYDKLIAIGEQDTAEEEEKAIEAIKRLNLRHEIIHAFLHESGLYENSLGADNWAMNEEMVDWIALQFPKLLKAFKEVGAIEGCKCNKHLSYEELEKSRQLFEKANDATFDRFIDKFLEE